MVTILELAIWSKVEYQNCIFCSVISGFFYS